MTGKKQERLKRILELLSAQVGASMKALAVELSVAEITVRRDIEALVRMGTVKLINGVAVYTPPTEAPAVDDPYDIGIARTSQSRQKEAIGRLAASLIAPNDVIAIDAGTTAEALSAHLPDVPLSVVTASVPPLLLLKDRPNCQLICAGGYFRHNTQMFQSPEGISLIARTSINKAFMTAAGINSKLNVTCIDPHEIQFKRTIMDASVSHVLLVDSGKFNIICPGTFAHLTDFETIITDDGLSEAWEENIRGLGVELMIARTE